MLERLMNLAVFQSIGPFELLIVLGIVLVIFGPKRLPSLGRQLGSGMREFKDSITRKSDDDDDDEDDDSGAATRSQAAAALGRPDEETATQPASDGVISEKP
jgi:sec-independent protein translocase protein TatA